MGYILRSPVPINITADSTVQDEGYGFIDATTAVATARPAEVMIPKPVSARRDEKDPGVVTTVDRVFVLTPAAGPLPAVKTSHRIAVASGPDAGHYTIREVQVPRPDRMLIMAWRQE